MITAGVYINFHTHHPPQEGHTSLFNYIVKDGTENTPGHIFSAGIHPWYINNLEQQLGWLKKISGEKNCLAIGEAGLDHECQTAIKIQETAFVEQCKLAVQLQKPMILHAVKSHFEVMRIMKEQGVKKAVFHGYNNRYTILEKVLENGFYVSIGAAVLNEKSPAAALIGQIPREKLFLETDDSSFSIEEIYAAAAAKLNLNLTDLQAQIAQNFNQLFV